MELNRPVVALGPTNVVGGAAMFDASYMAERNAIMDDRAASYWLKQAICVLEARDPIDAVNDAEVLLKIATLRMNTALGGRR